MQNKSFFLLFLIIIKLLLNNDHCFVLSKQNSEDDYYIGAVLEYSPVYKFNFSQDPVSYMLENVKQYSMYIEEAINQGVDIIVFPEYGIIGDFFDPTRDGVLGYLEEIPEIPSSIENSLTPCTDSKFNNRPIMKSLSCLARQYSIYMVADMGDVQHCTIGENNCTDGRFQYNTQVVFDREGRYITKYHKSHLYFESYFDVPTIPDIVTFETDFNVTFGMMICFDILFKEPQSGFLNNTSINNLVYSTEWVNTNFAYAREVQLSWSYVNNYNILAANIGTSSFNSGSGIYSSGKILNSTINPNISPTSQLLISEIPKIPSINYNNNNIFKNSNNNNNSKKNFNQLFNGPNLNSTNIYFTISPNQNETFQISNNGLTCKFNYISSLKNNYEPVLYQLSSYKGILIDNLSVEICLVSICPGNDINNCVNIYFSESNVTVNSFTLTGNFDSDYRIYPMISSVPLVSISKYDTSSRNTVSSNLTIKSFIGSSLFGVNWD